MIHLIGEGVANTKCGAKETTLVRGGKDNMPMALDLDVASLSENVTMILDDLCHRYEWIHEFGHVEHSTESESCVGVSEDGSISHTNGIDYLA